MTQQPEDNKPKPVLLTEQLINEVCAYLAKGQSQSAFCRDKGISLSTWGGWLRSGRKAAIKGAETPDGSRLALKKLLYQRIEEAKSNAPPRTNPNGGRKAIDLVPHAEKIAEMRSKRMPLNIIAGLVGVCPDTLTLWLKSGDDLLAKKDKGENILCSEEKYLDFIIKYKRVYAENMQALMDKAEKIVLEPRTSVQQRFLPQQQNTGDNSQTTDDAEPRLVLAERLENEMPPNPSVALRFLESMTDKRESAKSRKKSKNLAIFDVPPEIQDVFYDILAQHDKAHVIHEAAEVYQECLVLAQQAFEDKQDDED